MLKNAKGTIRISYIMMRFFYKRRGGFKRRCGIKGREIKRLVFYKKKPRVYVVFYGRCSKNLMC
jgi:hypothetical protein